SSSEASSDFNSDALSDPSLRHPLSDHSLPDLPGTSAGPSRKRRRSPMTFVPAYSPISGALSPICANLIPSPKRVKDSGYLADVEVDHREISLRDDAIIREGAVEVRYERLGDLVQRFHDHAEAIPVYRIQLERDNRRHRGTASVESQRVDRL
ncbi:hypothetical protein Tco_0176162, partial [Tanacetum coccineum]